MISNLTKAETLKKIENIVQRKKIKNLVVPSFIYITKKEYLKNKIGVYNKIKNKFNNKILIIRSSSQDEDNKKFSNAGKYLSFQKIKLDKRKIFESIDKIIKLFKSPKDQILIQEYINKPDISGVIFTRETNYNSPYYVINYDKSGETNLVTSGKNNPTSKTDIIYRDKIELSKRFKNFLKLILNFEKYFKSDRLDIEFAYKGNKWHIFQCRYLPNLTKGIEDKEIKEVLINLEKKIKNLQNINPHLSGKTTIFSNMSDWNPAEMIGNKPKPLAISLYSELITNRIWGIQRKEYGYKDVSPNILMVNLAGTPFIDLRTDINSFLPSNLDNKICEKISNNSIKTLEKKPFLHDKIEFDLLLTCFDFDINYKKIDFLSAKEKKIYLNKLKKLTNKLLLNGEQILEDELNKVKKLNINLKKIKKIKNLNEIQKIFFLVDDCKNFGTLPFAGAARIAFVCTQILKNFHKRKVIDSRDVENIYSSIETITKQMNQEFIKIKKNPSKKRIFLKKYGHIRPATYSIESLNYKEGFKTYFLNKNLDILNYKKKKIELSSFKNHEITQLFKKEKFKISSKKFIKILKKSIQYREYLKFIFSKSINEIFETLIKLGYRLGISRSDLEFVSIETILSSYSILETEKLSKILTKEITKNKKSFNITKKIIFPDLILNSKDIYLHKMTISKGNFITQKKIIGNLIYLTNFKNLKKINKKIILLDNADPGYDFIFSYPIKALITKYGGANSHMAIRCLELSIPAIIGVGNSEFEKLKKSNLIEFDCEQKIIKNFQ